MIRKATVEDAGALTQLAIDFFSQGQICGTGLVLCEESIKKYMEGLVVLEGSIFFVAEDDGKIIGSIAGMVVPWMFNFSQKVSHEMWWFVDPEYRGIAGTFLLRKFYKESKRMGAIAIVVATSGNREEIRVIENYQKSGFKHLEHHFIKGL